MVGEDFVWNMLKKALDLDDNDVAELRAGVLSLKGMAPEYQKRLELIEKRIIALCYYAKSENEQKWNESWEKAVIFFDKQRK